MNQLSLFDRPISSTQEKKTDNRAYWKIFIDGASRNNPGVSGIGIYVLKNDTIAAKLSYYVGIKTNNQAEYLALIIGLMYIKKHVVSGDFIMIFSDSQLLVRQIEGIYKIKNPLLKPFYAVAKKLLVGLEYSIAHVMREDNSNADELANKGIDKKIALPAHEIDFLHEHELSIY